MVRKHISTNISRRGANHSKILGFLKSFRFFEDFENFLRDFQRCFEISFNFSVSQTFEIFKIKKIFKDFRDLARFLKILKDFARILRI